MKKLIFFGSLIALVMVFVPASFSSASSGSTVLYGGPLDGQVVNWSKRSPMLIINNPAQELRWDEGWLYFMTELGGIYNYDFIIYRNGVEVFHCPYTNNCYYSPVYDVTLDDVFTFYIQGVLQETFSYDRYAIVGCTDDQATNYDPTAEEDADPDSCVYGNTPAGSNVSVGPLSGATLNFSSVSQSGQTTVTASSSGSQPPSGFKLGTPPTYYDISTTATFAGDVEVCLSWTQGQFNHENNLKLFHFNGTSWNNITEPGYPDTVNNIICGLTTSFSNFAVFEQKQVDATIDIKPGAYPNTINLGSNGSVPVAIFSTSTFDARTVNPTTLTLASAPVQLKGNGTTQSSFQDVNNDGLLDLVVHVSTQALQLSPTDQMANLLGYTFDNTIVTGSDTVRVVQ